eukprot:TRINITY_DN1884_c0_g1_i1.p1 TRINITY_DN1884_c0_g1~~TRINITY_DN1884_c0_g1_i1.p1  ORF type:complete len:761 (+),score=155.02 TRINITY_DN1884_c0_g1_i1:85-2283(+)
MAPGPAPMLRSGDAAGLSSHTVTLKDLVDAKLLFPGDEMTFKHEKAVLNEFGNLVYKGKEYTSPSQYAKAVAAAIGLSKHYNGWKVVERDGRPIEQFRDKYYASIHGLHYEFPPPVTKKRKRQALGMPANDPTDESDRKRVDTGSSKIENTSADTTSLVGEPSSSTSSDGVEDEPATSSSDWRTPGANGCSHPRCPLCGINKGSNAQQHSTWSDILQVVLSCLSKMFPDREYFALSDDIYAYIDQHWKSLCSKPRSPAWRQTCKMTLAHSRYSHLFENGYEKLLKTGFWKLKNAAHVSLGAGAPAADDASAQDGSSRQGTTDDADSSSSDEPILPRGPAPRRAASSSAPQSAAVDSGSYNLRRRAKEAAGLLTLIDGISEEDDAAESNDDASLTRVCQGCKRNMPVSSNQTAESDFFICNSCMSKGVTRRGRYGLLYGDAGAAGSTRFEAVQALSRLQNDFTLDWSSDTALLPLNWKAPVMPPISAYRPRESIQLSDTERFSLGPIQFPPAQVPEELSQLRKENCELSDKISEERLVRLKVLAMARDAIEEADVLNRQTDLMWDDIDELRKKCDDITARNAEVSEHLKKTEEELALVKGLAMPTQNLRDQISALNSDGEDMGRKMLEMETELVLERQRVLSLEAQLQELRDMNQKLKNQQMTMHQMQMMPGIPQQMLAMQQYIYPNAAMRFFPAATAQASAQGMKPADLYMMQVRAAAAAAAAASGQPMWGN